jgi:hypothetical protein
MKIEADGRYRVDCTPCGNGGRTVAMVAGLWPWRQDCGHGGRSVAMVAGLWPWWQVCGHGGRTVRPWWRMHVALYVHAALLITLICSMYLCPPPPLPVHSDDELFLVRAATDATASPHHKSAPYELFIVASCPSVRGHCTARNHNAHCWRWSWFVGVLERTEHNGRQRKGNQASAGLQTACTCSPHA